MKLPSFPSLRSLNVPLAIFALVVALLVFGLVEVYSASATLAGYEKRVAQARVQTPAAPSTNYHDWAYLKRQLQAAAVGMAGLLFLSGFDYRRLKRWSFWIMIGSFALCCMVWLPGLGVKANGANRWIRMGPLGTFQPSELAKLGLIIYMAKMLDDRHRYIKSFFSGVLPAMFVTGVFGLIIVLEPHFSSFLVLGLIVFGMWICGEMRWFHLGGLAFCTVPAVVVAFILKPYRVRRLFAFFSDDRELMMREGYQLHQSLVAVGSGGWDGVGLGQSMQKYHYLYAGHTDFIFSILAEELGFVGGTIVILLFASLIALGFWVALNSSDLFGSLLATGIALMIFIQSAMNLAVALGLLPTTGMVLPFMSYGGSSLMVMLWSMGILMNIAQRQFALTERTAGWALAGGH